jgi:hypothetical protein
MIWLYLRRVPPVVWGVLLACVLAASVYQKGKATGRTEGATQYLATKLVHDTVVMHTRDTITLRETKTLTRLVTRYDTVRSTLTITDTIEVKQYIAVADSTIRQCKETVLAYALSCAAKDTVIATQRALLAVKGVGRTHHVRDGAVGAIIGIALATTVYQFVK